MTTESALKVIVNAQGQTLCRNCSSPIREETKRKHASFCSDYCFNVAQARIKARRNREHTEPKKCKRCGGMVLPVQAEASEHARGYGFCVCQEK